MANLKNPTPEQFAKLSSDEIKNVKFLEVKNGKARFLPINEYFNTYPDIKKEYIKAYVSNGKAWAKTGLSNISINEITPDIEIKKVTNPIINDIIPDGETLEETKAKAKSDIYSKPVDEKSKISEEEKIKAKEIKSANKTIDSKLKTEFGSQEAKAMDTTADTAKIVDNTTDAAKVADTAVDGAKVADTVSDGSKIAQETKVASKIATLVSKLPFGSKLLSGFAVVSKTAPYLTPLEVVVRGLTNTNYDELSSKDISKLEAIKKGSLDFIGKGIVGTAFSYKDLFKDITEGGGALATDSVMSFIKSPNERANQESFWDKYVKQNNIDDNNSDLRKSEIYGKMDKDLYGKDTTQKYVDKFGAKDLSGNRESMDEFNKELIKDHEYNIKMKNWNEENNPKNIQKVNADAQYNRSQDQRLKNLMSKDASEFMNGNPKRTPNFGSKNLSRDEKIDRMEKLLLNARRGRSDFRKENFESPTLDMQTEGKSVKDFEEMDKANNIFDTYKKIDDEQKASDSKMKSWSFTDLFD